MLISLIGVGFATWTIIEPTREFTEDGKINVEEVLKMEVLTEPQFDTNQLRYNKNGFLNKLVYDPKEDDLINSDEIYSIINYSVKVNLPLCYQNIKDLDYVELHFTLKSNCDYDNLRSSVYDLIDVSLSDGVNTYNDSVKVITNDKIDIYIKIPVNATSTEMRVYMNLDFKRVTDPLFFQALSVLRRNEAFTISAYLYALYE
jgi:hypothetical protein